LRFLPNIGNPFISDADRLIFQQFTRV